MPKLSHEQRVKLDRSRLDEAGVRAHFASVSSHGLAIEIRVKGDALAQSDEATPDLDVVAERLCAGHIVGVQLRYARDGAWWCDTVMRRGDDFRLVRMRQADVIPVDSKSAP